METKNHWYMLTLVGEDQKGIVAHITAALDENGCNLGETSMLRLGGNFTIMMMVEYKGSKKSIHDAISNVAESLGLSLHVDAIKAHLHQHQNADVRISVYGADRPGIVSMVTNALNEVGLNILDLESDVAGSKSEPLFVMNIEGHATEGVAAIEAALELVRQKGVEANLSTLDTMLG